MAHPYQSHRGDKVEKQRVSKIAHRASGGRIHGDEAEDKSLVKKMVKKTSLKVEGDKPKHHMGRKRGGRVGKGGKTVVNVNVAPPAPSIPPLAPGGLAAKPPMMPPPGPPAGGPPPGGPPPGGPPPMAGGPGGPGPMPPMRKRGGAVKSGPAFEEGKRLGTQVSHDPGKNDTDDMKRPHMKMHPKVVTFATGGGVVSFRANGGKVEAPGPGKGMGPKLPGGVAAGETRLAQAARAKRGD